MYQLLVKPRVTKLFQFLELEMKYALKCKEPPSSSVWTSQSEESYLITTIHFIGRERALISNLLQTSEVYKTVTVTERLT